MSLAIVGGTVVDVIFSGVPRLPVWPRHTEFTATNLVLLERGPIVTMGGNGANAAYVAAASGTDTVLHTRIGADVLGAAGAQLAESRGLPDCRAHRWFDGDQCHRRQRPARAHVDVSSR